MLNFLLLLIFLSDFFFNLTLIFLFLLYFHVLQLFLLLPQFFYHYLFNLLINILFLKIFVFWSLRKLVISFIIELLSYLVRLNLLLFIDIIVVRFQKLYKIILFF